MGADYQKLLAAVRTKRKSEFPAGIKPMLATLVDEPFDEDGWLYEIKWDGFRALVYLKEGKVRICSRNNKDFNEKFYPVYNAFKEVKLNAVFDGEIVVLDKQGIPDFAALQGWRSEADGLLAYYIFDLLWIDGFNLLEVPLRDRRRILEAAFPENKILKVSETISVSGKEFYKVADDLKLEGIIAKKADSTYKPDKRTKDWLKIKTQRFQEAVIGGYTINKGTSKKFSSLLVGIFENDEFISVATVGTGFTSRMQNEIIKKLDPLRIKYCPFKDPPEYNKPSRFRPNPPPAEVIWVKPEVVVEISYRTISPDGSFRHPSFKGIREDKKAKEVKREIPEHTPDLIETKNILVKEKIITKPGKLLRSTLLNPSEETQTRLIGGREVKFTNLSKVFWPGINITKRDMINYYYQVVPYILPYIKDRPQTLNRYPNGINGKSFYQKDVTGKVPSWIETFKYYSYRDKKEKQFVICSNEESLLYLANLACIEINPWSSRAETPDQPDWCIIDLDPAQTTFQQVIDVACITKNILDAIRIKAFCKTSGSSGLHIYIPLQSGYTFTDSKEFGRLLAKIIHTETKSFTSIERLTENREGKMYIDFLQNRPQATVAAPYSLRPREMATVSMPLHWDEVKKGLKIKDFTINTAPGRIAETGDLFMGVLTEKNSIEKATTLIEKQFGIKMKTTRKK